MFHVKHSLPDNQGGDYVRHVNGLKTAGYILPDKEPGVFRTGTTVDIENYIFNKIWNSPSSILFRPLGVKIGTNKDNG